MGSLYQERTTRSLVKRLGAERYIFTSLIAFAASVVLTRLFLAATGYPQVGNAHLHIAHVLWGGLLLFVGGLLPLILANAWAYSLGAAISGVGMGLFIDEVGKFITQNNDYFYPAAAPIIYAVFLLTVMLYLYVRQAGHRSPRQEMYEALHDMGEVIDHDLDFNERRALEERLQRVIDDAPGSNLALLASTLLVFLHDEELRLAAIHPSRLQLLKERVYGWGKHINRPWYRSLLVGMLIGGGLIGLSQAARLGLAAFNRETILGVLRLWLMEGQFHTANELRWLFIRMSLEVILAVLLLIAAGLLASGREKLGLQIGITTLVMLLTTVNLLVFYFDQFSAVIAALAQYTLLALLEIYRRWYLVTAPSPTPTPTQDGHWDDGHIRE